MQEKYLDYHNKRFDIYKDDVKSLWGSEYSQKLRFKVFTRQVNLTNADVLDIGCGFGDFYGYLKENNVKIKSYLGFDINQNHLSVAKEKYPETDFNLVDILEDEVSKTFDFVFASGIFFLKCENWEDYFLQMIKKMFALSKNGIAFNLLSCHSVNPDEVSYYSNPAEILSLITKNVSPFAILDHSYKQNDYTFFIYKSIDKI